MSPAAHHALERDAGEIDGTHHHSRSLRERKKEKTRAAIHTAAVRLTMEWGLADVSIHAICSAADVSSRTFFNYFPSKVAAVIGSGDLTVSESRRSRFLADTDSTRLVDDLCALVAGLITDMIGGPEHYAELRHLADCQPEIVSNAFSLLPEMRHCLIELAALRAEPQVASAASTLVIAALVHELEHTRIVTESDLAASLRRNVAAMHALARS